jgi:hypothetical protein
MDKSRYQLPGSDAEQNHLWVTVRCYAITVPEIAAAHPNRQGEWFVVWNEINCFKNG